MRWHHKLFLWTSIPFSTLNSAPLSLDRFFVVYNFMRKVSRKHVVCIGVGKAIIGSVRYTTSIVFSD